MAEPDGAFHQCADLIQCPGHQLGQGVGGGIFDQGQPGLGHPHGQPFLGLIPENQHHPGDLVFLVADGRGRVGDGPPRAVSGNEQGVVGHVHHGAFAQDLGDRVFHLVSRFFIDDAKDRFQRFAVCLRPRPAGKGFGHGIHEDNFTISIGRDQPVTNGFEGNGKMLLCLLQVRQGAKGSDLIRQNFPGKNRRQWVEQHHR